MGALDHQRQIELLAAFLGQGEADQAAAVLGHEVDRFGRDLLGRDDQIAFILAILVVDDDHHATLAEELDRLVVGASCAGNNLRRAYPKEVAPPLWKKQKRGP